MEQMKPDGLDVVHLNYADNNLPESVQQTHPLVYIDGDAYCCILGPDPERGVFGCGRSVKEALDDFDRHYAERLAQPVQGDPVSEFIQQRHI
jgi:hypothetical protein